MATRPMLNAPFSPPHRTLGVGPSLQVDSGEVRHFLFALLIRAAQPGAKMKRKQHVDKTLGHNSEELTSGHLQDI